jgi:hypothetical protein
MNTTTETRKAKKEDRSGYRYPNYEAYGTKGLKSTQWRKTFKTLEALNKWVEKNDAEVGGIAYPEA